MKPVINVTPKSVVHFYGHMRLSLKIVAPVMSSMVLCIRHYLRSVRHYYVNNVIPSLDIPACLMMKVAL
jgi:hypothetical protein